MFKTPSAPTVTLRRRRHWIISHRSLARSLPTVWLAAVTLNDLHNLNAGLLCVWVLLMLFNSHSPEPLPGDVLDRGLNSFREGVAADVSTLLSASVSRSYMKDFEDGDS
jgi:hypothetical protein